MGKRRWILWFLVISFVWLIFSRSEDIENLWLTLREGVWLWVLAAAAVQVSYYVVQAALYKATYETVGVRSNLWELIPVVLGSLFINVVAPSGGTAGLALFVDDASQRGESPARAAAGTLLSIIGMYGTLALLVIVSLVYLSIYASLTILQVVVAGALVLVTAAISGLLVLGYKRPQTLREIMFRIQQLVNGLAARVKRPPLLESTWAAQTAVEFTEAAGAVGGRPQRLLLTTGLALGSHAINVATLYMLFLAFRQPDISLAGLIAGYAIGHSFVIMAPTPQGVGFVENVMPNVYIAVGVPSAVATITVLAYRGLTFWLPLLIGFFMLQRLKSLGAEERSLTEVWSVRIVAVLTGLMGLINAWTVIWPLIAFDVTVIPGVPPNLAEDLAAVAEYSPLEIQRGGQLTAAVSGLALLLLAHALWRRKRAAWVVTLLVLLVSTLNHLYQRDWIVAGLAIALAGWLFMLRPHFHARSDRPSVRQAVQLLLVAMFFILLYGIVGFYWLARLTGQPFTTLDALRQTFTMMTRFYDPGYINVGEAGQILGLAIYVLSGLTYAYVFVLLIRPVLMRQTASPEQRRRAQSVVGQYGRSAQAIQALWRAKQFFFSEAGSVVAYDVNGRIAVALGDPVGPSDDIGEAVAEFDAHCRRNDWTPAFYQAHPTFVECYREQGYHVVGIGREGRIQLDRLNLARPTYAALEEKIEHARALGYRTEVLEPPLPDSILDTLQQISDEWLTAVNTGRKRIWLGWFDRDYVRRRTCVLVYTPEDTITAFATLIQPPQSQDLTVDLLQHRLQVQTGTIGLLFMAAIEWAQQQEFNTLYCGTSPLENGNDSARNRLFNSVYQNVSQYTFRDTHEVEQLLAPDWAMRYLAYRGTMSLPAIWNALIHGEGHVFGTLWGVVKRQLGL